MPSTEAPSPDQRARICDLLRSRLPRLMAIHAFGSRPRGEARDDSDLDLALLVEGHADPRVLWDLAADIAALVGHDVDLLDLRAASTVMQHQILTTGERWWARDSEADLWELAMLSEKFDLDRARAPLLEDIRREGRIHGR
jgi:predicted nucleotidyltransferase